MGGGDQLDTALGDGTRRDGLQLRTDLVDHDHLRHVVLDRFDHHGMLQRRGTDLHPPRAPDPRVRDVAVTADLIGGVDDHHPLFHLVSQHPGTFAEHRGLPDPRAAEQEDALAPDHHVLDDVDGAGDRPAHPAGQPDDLSGTIPDSRDPMQGPLEGMPNVYLCAGFTGHGMGFAFMTAKQVAESI